MTDEPGAPSSTVDDADEPTSSAPLTSAEPEDEALAAAEPAPLPPPEVPAAPQPVAEVYARDTDRRLWSMFAFCFAWFILTDRAQRGQLDAWTIGLCVPAVLVMLRPSSLLLMLWLAGVQLTWFTVNWAAGRPMVHWYIQATGMTVVSAGVAALVARQLLDRQLPRIDTADLIAAIRGPTRWILAIGIFFTGLAKMNESFLDPDVSCAAVYYKHLLLNPLFRWLPEGIVGDWFAIVMTVFCEVIGPILLVIPRTRAVGVASLWVLFLALFMNYRSYYFEFAGLFFSLMLLWLATSLWASIFELWSRARSALVTWLPWAVGRALSTRGWFFALAVGAALTTLGGFLSRKALLELARWSSTLLLLLVALSALLAVIRLHWRLPERRPTTKLARAVWLVTALFVFNEGTPYVGLWHSPALIMAANLRLNPMASNHVIFKPVPTLPFSEDIEIVDGRATKLPTGRHMPWPLFAYQMARRPDAEVTYRVAPDGPVQTIKGSELTWSLSRPLAWIFQLRPYQEAGNQPMVCPYPPPSVSYEQWKRDMPKIRDRTAAKWRGEAPPPDKPKAPEPKARPAARNKAPNKLQRQPKADRAASPSREPVRARPTKAPAAPGPEEPSE